MRARVVGAARKLGFLSAFLVFVGCECGQRHALDVVPSAPYPLEDEGELELARVLRSGPTMPEQEVVERFELRRSGDHRIFRVQQEWPLATSDVEVIYDPEGMPIRIWRHTTMPNVDGQVGHDDLRVYDLRGSSEVLLARRGPDGTREGVAIRGPARPTVVIGPGRGLLTAWFQRARLDVGAHVREWAIDVREPLALVGEVTLTRHPDQEVEGLGRARVYTIYGREPVFADQEDVAIGDMMGLRDASTVDGPVPDPMPDPGPFDTRLLP